MCVCVCVCVISRKDGKKERGREGIVHMRYSVTRGAVHIYCILRTLKPEAVVIGIQRASCMHIRRRRLSSQKT